MATRNFSEDELGKKWDMCINDGIIKIGGGFMIGVLGSLLLFKRKKWPLLLGSGFGFGLAYANCERDLNATFKSHQTQ